MLESICRSVRLSTKFDSPDWQTSYMNHMSCFILFLQGVYLNSSSYFSSFIQFWIFAAFLNEWTRYVASSLFLQGRFLKPVPGTRICIYLGWNLGGFCLLSLSRSLWVVSPPSIVSAAPPVYSIFSCSPWGYALFCSPHHYEDAEQHRSQYCLLRHASHNLPPCTLQTTVHYSLSLTVQPVSCWPFLLSCVQSIAPQLGCEDALRDCNKRLAKVHVSSIYCLPLIHRACHFILEGSQINRYDFPSLNMAASS